MRESREALDGVVERLRDITTELEHIGRGDVKHLHLRQLEYETIQVSVFSDTHCGGDTFFSVYLT